MKQKIFNAIVHLRRDNEFNYQPDSILAYGEVCFVDTAKKGLRVKVGDGKTPYSQLEFLDISNSDVIVRGYFYDEKFYEDAEHTIEIIPSIYYVYISMDNFKLYIYVNNKYEPICGSADIPMATPEIAGIMKLYNSLGDNTDGTINQQVITDELGNKAEVSIEEEEETLVITK